MMFLKTTPKSSQSVSQESLKNDTNSSGTRHCSGGIRHYSSGIRHCSGGIIGRETEGLGFEEGLEGLWRSYRTERKIS